MNAKVYKEDLFMLNDVAGLFHLFSSGKLLFPQKEGSKTFIYVETEFKLLSNEVKRPNEFTLMNSKLCIQFNSFSEKI